MKSVLLLVSASFPLLAADFETITVSGGQHNRHNSIVSFRLQRPLARDAALIGNGKTYPLQASADGIASFVLDQLGKDQELTLKMGRAEAEQRLEPQWDKTRVKLGPSSGRWLEFQAQPGALPRTNIKQVFQRGAYLHPIRTLAGTVITDDYPANHVHHHGLWWAWTKTEFDGRAPDFWNMGGGKGTIERLWNDYAHPPGVKVN